MPTNAVFGLSTLMAFVAFGIVTRLYIGPWLARISREDALIALAIPHAFRFIGLSFLVPGVVSPSLPPAFAVPAAYGDLGATVLAIVAIWAIVGRRSWAMAIFWVFNLWGTIDLVYAFVAGATVRMEPGSLGATFFIPTLIVPALLVTHGLMFWLLLRPRQS
jgi:hypothetical protein